MAFSGIILSGIQSGGGSVRILLDDIRMSGSGSPFAIGDEAFSASVATSIAFDATSNSGSQTGGSYSFNATVSGTNRYLIVGVSMTSIPGASVSSITFGGQSLTKIGSVANSAVISEIWGLVAPNTGTASVSVTLSTLADSVSSAVSFIGVHQTTPTESYTSATGQTDMIGGGNPTLSDTTTADNDWVVDCLASATTFGTTVGSGQVQRSNVNTVSGNGSMSTEGPKTPAGSVSMDWTLSGMFVNWALSAVALVPAAVSSPTSHCPVLSGGILRSRTIFSGSVA